MSMENSERSAFIGVNVKPQVKHALEVLLRRQGKTHPTTGRANVSRFVSDLLEETLKRAGIKVK